MDNGISEIPHKTVKISYESTDLKFQVEVPEQSLSGIYQKLLSLVGISKVDSEEHKDNSGGN